MFVIWLGGSTIGLIASLRLRRDLRTLASPGHSAVTPSGPRGRTIPPSAALVVPVIGGGLALLWASPLLIGGELLLPVLFCLALVGTAVPLVIIVGGIVYRYPRQTLCRLGGAVPLGTAFSFVLLQVFAQALDLGWLDATPLGVMNDPYRMMPVVFFLPWWGTGVVGLFVAIGCAGVRRRTLVPGRSEASPGVQDGPGRGR